MLGTLFISLPLSCAQLTVSTEKSGSGQTGQSWARANANTGFRRGDDHHKQEHHEEDNRKEDDRYRENTISGNRSH